MGAARKIFSFISVGVLVAFAMAVFCSPLAADCISVLSDGRGERQYLAAGAGAAALVSRSDDGLRVTTGTLEGEKTGETAVTLPVSAGTVTVSAVYPAADGAVWLGLYEPGDEGEELALYRVTDDGTTERMLAVPCTYDARAGRPTDTFLSSFSESDGLLRFAVIDGSAVEVYTYGSAGDGLEQEEPLQAFGADTAAVLPDGTVALGGDGWLEVDGRSASFPLNNCIVTNLTQVGAGFYYIDGASLKVFYSDLTATECAEAFDLGRSMDLENVTSLSLAGEGRALVLTGGDTLTLVGAEGAADLTGLLYRPAAACVLILLGLVLGWLLLTAAVWYLLCGRQRSHLPLAVRAGGQLAVCALVVGTLLIQLVVRPMVTGSVSRGAQNVLAGTAALAAEQADDDELPAHIAESLAALPTGDYAGTTAAVCEQTEDGWMVVSGPLPAGCRAELLPGFSADLAGQAAREGSAFVQQDDLARLCLDLDGRIVLITAAGRALDAQPAIDRASYSLWGGIALLWAAAVIVLLVIGSRVGRISRAMELLSGGRTDTRMDLATQDEMEGVSSAFNSMARAMQQQEDDRDGLIRAYLRFVPERVLGLLGKQSILEVDKRTFASRRMSTMTVWFAFSGRVYDNSTRAMFESINEVIERTAAIVARKGGTVFNFAYNGYDVVLGGGAAEAVSTAVAVQQEVLSLNEQRAMDGRPTVTLRIALDVGEVMIGIVGDETQMEPATISASFTTARRLIGLAKQLEAGILCTENAVAGAEGYASRYMGKSRQGSDMIRVYEIFDGDPFGVRRGKKTSGAQFSQGVFALYSHDFAAAKRIFLELVHEHPGDGGARYYLYLADRLSRQPDQEISLEYGLGDATHGTDAT